MTPKKKSSEIKAEVEVHFLSFKHMIMQFRETNRPKNMKVLKIKLTEKQ